MERPSNPSAVYLDSCVLIESLTNPNCLEIRRVLDLIQHGTLIGMISAVSMVEVLGSRTRRDGADSGQEQRARSLVDHPTFTVVEIGRAVALRARRYALDLRIKPVDAIHLASAVVGGADVLMTLDVDFARKAQAVGGIWVGEPYEPGDATLFPAP